jgi:hypothetical protein
MSSTDLTTLVGLKTWLGLPAAASPSDATLAALITATSRAVYAQLSRPALAPQNYTETIDLETQRVFLRQWPVVKVNWVTWRGLSVPASQPGNLDATSGYALQPGDSAPPGRPQALDLFGGYYRPGRQSLVVSYCAGYALQGETQTVPSASPYAVTVLAPYGPWASDLGAVYAATGVAMTPVATAPAAGQYSVSGGVYTFSAADSGQSISLSYGYTPQDIAQATMELAAARFRAADHIGLTSKSLGGQETIAYDASALPASVVAMLQPYKRLAV